MATTLWDPDGGGPLGPALVVGGGGLDQVKWWNGTQWIPIGGEHSGNARVYALTTYNGDIIAGGDFTTIGGQVATGVARRNATTGQWSALGMGLTGSVLTLAVHNGVLHVGGDFNRSLDGVDSPWWIGYTAPCVLAVGPHSAPRGLALGASHPSPA